MSAAPGGVPTPWNPKYIMDYSGGSYDPERDELIVWGGGHADYPGNEVCRFARATGTWTCGMRSDPGPFNALGYPLNTVDMLADGNPAARHTYGSLAWVNLGTLDGFFVHGGSLAGDGYATYGAWFCEQLAGGARLARGLALSVCCRAAAFPGSSATIHDLGSAPRKPIGGGGCDRDNLRKHGRRIQRWRRL